MKLKQWDEATKYFETGYRPAFTSFDGAIAAFIAYQTDGVEKVGAETEHLATSTRTLIIGLASAALLIGMLLAFLTTRSITGPTKKLVDGANKMADGDFSIKFDIDSRDEVGVLADAMRSLQASVVAMSQDATMLAKAAVEGRLATRADASKHKGDFQKIVLGVNNTLDAVIGPLNVTADYVDKISKGMIPPVISDSYNGDFNVIKNNLNACIEATE